MRTGAWPGVVIVGFVALACGSGSEDAGGAGAAGGVSGPDASGLDASGQGAGGGAGAATDAASGGGGAGATGGAAVDGSVAGSPIPANRLVPWSPGVSGGLPAPAAACPASASSVRDFGALGDGITDDAPAFIAAIAAAVRGNAVRVPAGTYLVRGGLTIDKGIVLCGEGPAVSRLLFEGDAPGISIIKYDRGDFMPVRSGLTKGATELGVDDASGFIAGAYAEIQQTNDWSVMDPEVRWRNETWVPAASVGQVMRVTAIHGNTLVVDPPLSLDFDPAFAPVVRRLGLVEGAGLQGLYLARNDTADQETVLIKNAASCWVRDCEGENTMRAHVAMESTLGNEVRDSYFHHAHDYGGGGHGYGVSLGLHVTATLTENNLFVHLRHSMIAQTGATLNVFAYNYSIDPFQNEGGNWTPCDISLHGHYANGNLYEGNTVQEVDVSDYWGATGPRNTFYRNRVEAEGIEVMDYSHGQNIVGNELGTGLDVLTIDSTVTDTFVHGNYQNGAIGWDPATANHTLPPSLFLGSKPAFFGSTPWPATGADLIPNGGKLPAQQRYESM